MFHSKTVLSTTFLLMAILYVVGSQHVSAQLSLKIEPNMFRSPRQSCTCIGCTCGGGTCPQNVAARGYISFSATCSTSQVVSSLNINVQSTDGSGFKFYTMKDTEFEKYKQGIAFSYYSDASQTGSITCGNYGPFKTDQQSVKVVVECQNVLMSCPLKYSVSSGCSAASATIAGLSMSTPSTVNSGQTFSTTVKLVDSSGNTISSGGIVTLSLDGSGTLGGSTTSQFSNGIATFSNSITVSNTATTMIKATFSSGGSEYSQSRGISVQTGSNPVDYTSAWVGTWQVQDGCDVNTCCCLSGSISVTKTNTNTVFLTGPIKGQCQGSLTMSASVPNIDSDTTLTATILGNSFVLTRNGKELTVVNQMATQCSGRALKTSDSSQIIRSTMALLICLVIYLFI